MGSTGQASSGEAPARRRAPVRRVPGTAWPQSGGRRADRCRRVGDHGAGLRTSHRPIVHRLDQAGPCSGCEQPSACWLCLALLAAIAGDDLVLQGVDDDMQLAPLCREPDLHLVHDRSPADRCRSRPGAGEDAVVHDLVDEAAAGRGGRGGIVSRWRRLGSLPKVIPEARISGSASIRLLSSCPLRRRNSKSSRSTRPVKEAPVIGNLTFDVLGCLPPLTQIVEVRFGDVGQITRLEDDVDGAAVLAHRGQATCMPPPALNRD